MVNKEKTKVMFRGVNMDTLVYGLCGVCLYWWRKQFRF